MPTRSSKGSIHLQNKDLRKIQIKRRLSKEIQILEEKQKKRQEEQQQQQQQRQQEAALREEMQRTLQNEHQMRVAKESRDAEQFDLYPEDKNDVVNVSDDDNYYKELSEEDSALYSSASEHVQEVEGTKQKEQETEEKVEELSNQEIQPEIVVLQSMSLITSEQSCKSFSKELSEVSSILDVSDSNGDSSKNEDDEEQAAPVITLEKNEVKDHSHSGDAIEETDITKNMENEIDPINNSADINENAEVSSALEFSDRWNELETPDVGPETNEEEELEEVERKHDEVEWSENEDENLDVEHYHDYEEEEEEEEEELEERKDVNVEEHEKDDIEKWQGLSNTSMELSTEQEVVSCNVTIVVDPIFNIILKEEEIFTKIMEKVHEEPQQINDDDNDAHRECVQIEKATSPDFIMPEKPRYTQSAPKRHYVNSAQVRASTKANANVISISRPPRAATAHGRSKLSYLRAWREERSQENASFIDLLDTPQEDDQKLIANNNEDNNNEDSVNMDYVRNETTPYEELNFDFDLTDKRANDSDRKNKCDESEKEISLPTDSEVKSLSLRQRNELKMKLIQLMEETDFTKAFQEYKRLDVDGVHYKAARGLFRIISHNKSVIIPEDMYTLLYLFTVVGVHLQEAYAFYDENHFHRSGLSFNDFVLHIETLVERLHAYDKFYALSDNDCRINAVWNRLKHVETGKDDNAFYKDKVESTLQKLCDRLNEQESNRLLLDYDDFKNVNQEENIIKDNNKTDSKMNSFSDIKDTFKKYNYTNFFVFRRYEELFIRAQEENYAKANRSTDEEQKKSTTSEVAANTINSTTQFTSANSSTSLTPLTSIKVSQQSTRVVEMPYSDDNVKLVVESYETNWWGESDNDINGANNSDSVCMEEENHNDSDDNYEDNDSDDNYDDSDSNHDDVMYKANSENSDAEDNEEDSEDDDDDDEDEFLMSNIVDTIRRHTEAANVDLVNEGYYPKESCFITDSAANFEAYETNWWDKEDEDDSADEGRDSPEYVNSKVSRPPLVDKSVNDTADSAAAEPDTVVVDEETTEQAATTEEVCEEKYIEPSAVYNESIATTECGANAAKNETEICPESINKPIAPAVPEKTCEPVLPSIRKKIRRRRIKTSAASTKHTVSGTADEEQFLACSLPNDHEFTTKKSKDDRLPKLARSAAQTRAIRHYNNLHGYGNHSEFEDDDDIIRKLRVAYSTYNRLTKY